MTIVDENCLEELAVYLGDQLHEVLEKYISDGDAYVARLRDSLLAGDFKGLADIAHPLKSTSQQIGAGSVAAIAREIEVNARRENDLDYAELIDRLPEQFEQVERFLRDYMARQGTASTSASWPGS
ncbi:Hpt domain-containing protein [Emcibacter nanhaiensis]|uniref:Hpt domain-containing protein n=1 Tax=Emcibacter nanhaiensis TaxID=1505037 RepID=A0A501PHD7_9PROT|nr:Hpt domain-containing protein [Emcibacter nanhaiensis]TPD59829.1 Hpt domain-containing protein [Emcibacter nanhaiensis]